MTVREFISVPPKLVPDVPQWGNYTAVLQRVPFFRYLLNSLVVATSISLLVAFTSALGGYVFAKMDFTGKKTLFRFILATMMFPNFLFLIPNFFLLTRIGWVDTYLALIMPFAVSGYGIFLLRQFIMNIPSELIECARIDGASQFRIFVQIIIPLSLPAMATLVLLTFVAQWNNFLWPMIITSFTPSLTTIPVGIAKLNLSFGSLANQHLVLAGMVIQVLPVILLFLFLQRYYVKGIVMTGFGGI
jgi:multiple sugar transport system permease protein